MQSRTFGLGGKRHLLLADALDKASWTPGLACGTPSCFQVNSIGYSRSNVFWVFFIMGKMQSFPRKLGSSRVQRVDLEAFRHT